MEKVDKNSSIICFTNTHIIGATKYPHKITRLNNESDYGANNLKKKYNFKVLIGKQGTLHYWHPLYYMELNRIKKILVEYQLGY